MKGVIRFGYPVHILMDPVLRIRIQCFLTLRSWKEKNSGSGMKIPDSIPRAFKQFFGLKIFKFFDVDLDPGSL